jgi:hypothetical protein
MIIADVCECRDALMRCRTPSLFFRRRALAQALAGNAEFVRQLLEPDRLFGEPARFENAPSARSIVHLAYLS